MVRARRFDSVVFNQPLRNLGFTLCEVLITLGIIGIVAEITIPSLVHDINNQNYATTLEKSYTLFNQVLIQLANDSGCAGNLACTGLFDASTSLQTTGDTIASYFKVIKNCGTVDSGCFSNTISVYYNGSGSRTTSHDTSTFYRFITVDNVSYAITSDLKNCASGGTAGTSMDQVCGQVIVDVNGLKGPNNYGRDIFFFFITNGKGPLLYPRGGKDQVYWQINNTCTPTNLAGIKCAGRVMEDSWQMKY